MAKKLGTTHTKNKKDTAGRRLGFKVFPSQLVMAGGIILRQRGTVFNAGENTVMGKDHTINSTITGIVDVVNKKFGNRVRKFLKVMLLSESSQE